MKPIVLDLFAGAGGLSEGLHMASWDVAVAVELNKDAADTYRHNHNELQHRNTLVMNQNIQNIGSAELQYALKEARNLSFKNVDIVVGGPPCQGFSVIGLRSLDDERNRLLLDFVRIVAIVKPKAFIVENVKGILSYAGHRMPAFLTSVFSAIGYNLSYDVVNSMDFGVPQDRSRVFFMGLRKDVANDFGVQVLKAPAENKPESIRADYNVGEFVTVSDAISDLPPGKPIALESRIWVRDEDVSDVQSEDFPYPLGKKLKLYQKAMRLGSKVITDNHTKGMSEQRLYKVSSLPEGGTLSSKGRSNAWRRLKMDKPCHTLQAHMGKDLKEFIHPLVNRWITVREAARLQSFPDRYRFKGCQGAQLRQIGNAVAPFLGWAVGKAIAQQLKLVQSSEFTLREPRVCTETILEIEKSGLCLELGNMINDEERTKQLLNQMYDIIIKLAKEDKRRVTMKKPL